MQNVKKGLFRTILIILALFALIGFSGCASLAGTFGIATEEYVNEKMGEAETRLSSQVQANQSKIDANRSQLEEFAATADKLNELIVAMEESVQTTRELQQLAIILEERLENLPVETIRQLVDILQQYLDAQGPAEAE